MDKADTEERFYTRSIEDTASALETDPARGLSAAEAARRLEEVGPNEFEKERRKSTLVKFLSQFKSFMILVLLAAAIVSGAVGILNGEGFTDAIIILIIVILNAIIGTVQEARAEQALDALQKMSAPHCIAMRDGQPQDSEVSALVPGDVVVLETGNVVPADLRLIEAVNLKIQESALTGESLPEDKRTDTLEGDVPLGDRENMAYSSSVVTYGRGRGIVVATGMKTEVGRIAAMIQSAPDTQTPMQKKIDQLGRFLGIGALTVCALIFLTGYLQGRDVLEMFMIAVSLAAAAIPEGLPAVSTIVLAVGVQRLAKQNAIVRNLPSVETLGSTGVICSDKTGTLTQNRMTIVKLFADDETADVPETLTGSQTHLLTAALLANDASLASNEGELKASGDPTETAFLDLGLRFGLDKNAIECRTPRQAEIPFDSDRKMMSTVNRNEDGTLALNLKGGLDEVLERSTSVWINGETRPLDEAEKERIRKENVAMAHEALRVLAVAGKPLEEMPQTPQSDTLERDLTFYGMVGMIDPPRMEVKDAVATCRAAGIKPVMITGDHLITAEAIAETLGIMEKDEKAHLGSDLDSLSDEQLQSEVGATSVYARVSPEHKVRIVKAFQANGSIVAMTGDGVNDAPALKLSDIGVAMGITGTDVSKEAADVVLADDNFATIVTAVREGRRIYDNILKAIQFMLSTNLGEILVIAVAILAGWPAPLLPIQILWINLVTDSLPALALSVDPAEPGVMERKPRDPEQSILNSRFLLRIALQGTMIGGLSLAAFLIGLRTSVEVAQTMTFAVLGFAQITHVLNVRSPYGSAFHGLFSNKLLLGALAIVFALMLIVIEIPALHDAFHLAPLDATHWFTVIALAIAPLPIVEAIKMVLRAIGKDNQAT